MEKDTFVSEWLGILQGVIRRPELNGVRVHVLPESRTSPDDGDVWAHDEIDVQVVDTGKLLRVPRINCVLDTQLDRIKDEAIFDVQKFKREREGLHVRGEQARNLRNTGQLAEAEAALSALLSEAEDLCGQHSCHLADFLKSIGILFWEQGHVVKEEMTFVRMDLLRDQSSPPKTLMSDLTNLIKAQLAVQHNADARHTAQRLRGLFATHPAEGDRNLKKDLCNWEKQACRADSAKKKEEGSRVSKLAQLATEANKAGTEGAGADVEDKSLPPSRQANVQQGPRSPMRQQVCAACGQGGTLLVCTACRAVKYCSPNCQRQDWKSHKTACRATASSANASSATKDAEALLGAVQQNAASSRLISPTSPSVLCPPLRSALRDPRLTYWFRIGDVCSTRLLGHDGAGLPRFLATPGVLTCITGFAWAPSGVAVAAHVDLNAVLRGMWRCVFTGQDLDRTLYQITSELRQCFGGVDAATVRISLVGGHRVSDHQPALKLILSEMPVLSRYHRERKTEGNGADEREFFSWYVRAACVGAGLAAAVFDTILLNVFEGEI